MNFFKRTAILFFLTIACASFSAAQKLPAPRRENLLNGLKILLWTDSQSPKVTVKLRIHDGAAFDPQDKMGTTALLADILFPSAEAKAFFTEDLSGSLDVTSNYDYVEITATGKPDAVQTILETIANAVTNPPITPENFTVVRDARLEKVRELEKTPSYIADRAVAKQLFGNFPYGRSADGTPESLLKIDRFDLIGARDRFFTADNATLAVVGNINDGEVYRISRQLFGEWKKAENKVPATFRQPDAPDTKELAIELPDSEKSLSRTAIAAAARNSSDFYATQILFEIREKQSCPANTDSLGSASYQSHLLRGIYIVSGNLIQNEPPATGRQPCQPEVKKDGKTFYSPLTQGDFDSAKASVENNYQKKTQSLTDLAELWLDADTYKLGSVKDEISKLNNVTFADVQRVNNDLQNQPMVKVIIKKSAVAKQ